MSNTVRLTPSLPEPVQISGLKDAMKRLQTIYFKSYNEMKIVLHAIAKKTKGFKGFQFGTVIGRFQVTSWQWSG